MQPKKDLSADEVVVVDHRKVLRDEFLESLGMSHVEMEEMKADASFRRYYRLKGAEKPMLLMQDPPDRPAIPPLVMVEPFVQIAEHLRQMGLRAPEIYYQDIKNGLLIIEDFGEDTYTKLFNWGSDPKPLYETAVDALVKLHKNPKRCDIDVPNYDDTQLIEETMLLLDWYLPIVTGEQPTKAMKESFTEMWRGLFEKFPQDQKTLVLRDFHVDNLMLTKDGEGIARCGMLDFQDALIGQFSYDLMSLLEDARRDVAPALKKHLYDRYVEAMGADLDKEGFDYSFRVLAAQRHAKVLGIFVRLSLRDGKDRYLDFIPHVQKLFVEAVDDPHLAPMKKWFEDNSIDIHLPLKLEEAKKKIVAKSVLTKGPQP